MAPETDDGAWRPGGRTARRYRRSAATASSRLALRAREPASGSACREAGDDGATVPGPTEAKELVDCAGMEPVAGKDSVEEIVWVAEIERTA